MDVIETLHAHRYAWERRPLLRLLYHDWYELIQRELSSLPGPSVELGCGIGSFKEFRPSTTATDVMATPWADELVDAEELPYADGSLTNLILIDVLHHLPRPSRFLAEAVRTLQRGGRVVMLEPYCSPVSTIAYRRFHHELTDLSADPFGGPALSSKAPLDSNQALATLIFWRRLDDFRSRYPELQVRRRSRLGMFAYPLSGGFSKRPLLPAALGRHVLRLERLLGFAAPLLAFRCLVTLEHEPERNSPGARRIAASRRPS